MNIPYEQFEGLYRSIFAATFEGILLHENDVIINVNPAFLSMFGYGSPDELVGKSASNTVITPEHRSNIHSRLKHGECQKIEIICIRKDGSKFLAESQTRQFVHLDRTFRIVTFEDISKRKMAEKALAESEEHYRTLAETSPDMIYLVDRDNIVRYVNKAGLAMFGHNRDVVVGKRIDEIFPHELAARHIESIGHVVETGRSHIGELVEIFPTGKRWIDARLSPVLDEKGVVTAVLGLSQDITDRKRAVEALAESEEKYRNLFETSTDAVFIVDRETGKLLGANSTACCLYGYSLEEFLCMKNTDVSAEPEKTKSAVQVGEKSVPLRYHRKKDGTIFPVEINGGYFSMGGKTIHTAFIRDISDRRKIEEQLQRAEKLESLKVFAGGIAHDFNNLLTGIFGYIDLAKLSLPKESPAEGYLDKSFSAFKRAKSLARQMLTFAKGGAPVKRAFQLPEVIRDCCTLALSGSNIKAEFAIDQGLWPVDGDEYQLSQVFSNLVINAWQAMPDGGTVTVYAWNRDIEAKQVGSLPAGRYVAVSINDEGIGIPQKIVNKIFDPFFTTKQQGSGLGLATSYSIIHRHGGHIDVVSKPGEGSVFTVWLPVSEKGINVVIDEDLEQDFRGSGRLLVMDDERDIREMVREILSMAGYDVVIAPEGKLALALFQQAKTSGKPFDVVILDLTVQAGMGGEKTVAELKKIDPDVNVIVSSGYSDNPVVSNFEKYGFSGMVPKPYRANELLRVVKKVMGKKMA